MAFLFRVRSRLWVLVLHARSDDVLLWNLSPMPCTSSMGRLAMICLCLSPIRALLSLTLKRRKRGTPAQSCAVYRILSECPSACVGGTPGSHSHASA